MHVCVCFCLCTCVCGVLKRFFFLLLGAVCVNKQPRLKGVEWVVTLSREETKKRGVDAVSLIGGALFVLILIIIIFLILSALHWASNNGHTKVWLGVFFFKIKKISLVMLNTYHHPYLYFFVIINN